jgi:hypothetical protein
MTTVCSRWLSALLFLLVGCAPKPNDNALCADYRLAQSHAEVLVNGNVAAFLGIHNGYSGLHEQFLMHLRSGCSLTVRVAVNVAFTGPIPLHTGEAVVVRGEYEYGSGGGVIHWTHRAGRSHHQSGYVIAGNRFYW